MSPYPRWFLPLLLAALLAIVVTGLALAPTTLALRFDASPPWRLPGAARVGVAALHSACGLLLMLLTGALWSLHMRTGWRRRRQRGSGLLLGTLMLLLAATAVGVSYLGDESLANLAALTHLLLGLALALPFAWHWLHGRRGGHHGGHRGGHRRGRGRLS